MAHRYVLKLSEQYKEATGGKYLTLDVDFLKWCYEYQRTLEILKDQYKKLGINYNSYDSYETDKGIDSFYIESFIDPTRLNELYDWYKVLGVFPFDANDNKKRIDKLLVDSLISEPKNRISKYVDENRKLQFIGARPVYLENTVNYDLSGAKLFYTYNPYNCDPYDPYVTNDLALYPSLWSIKKNIAISVCGNNDDKDRKAKIEMLNLQSNYLKQLYEEGEYPGYPIKESRTEVDNKYFYTVYTDPTPTYGSARMR